MFKLFLALQFWISSNRIIENNDTTLSPRRELHRNRDETAKETAIKELYVCEKRAVNLLEITQIYLFYLLGCGEKIRTENDLQQ